MSMIGVDYGVLNQRGSPSWFSDIYANIPTAGYKGRMFISTDTFAFYRDTGTGWDLIGGPGTGTITGAGVSGQVSYFNGSSTLAGSNNLFWDNTNGRLGIGTTTPGVPLDIHATGTNATFNGTSTNNAYLVFQNAGTSKWRIGNTYNAGANSFDVYNNGLTTNAISISSTTNEITINSLTSSGSIIANGILGAAGGLDFLKGNLPPIFTGGDVVLYAESGTNNIIFRDLSSKAKLLFDNSTQTYTFPASSGTIALVGGSGVGTVTSVAAITLGTTGTDLSSSVANSTTTPVITLNVPTASASNRGALSSADWTTFNNKQATITNPITGTGATGQVAYWNGTATETGSNNLFWDNTNARLGINTIVPNAGVTSYSTTASTQFKAAGTSAGITFTDTVVSPTYASAIGIATAVNNFVTGTAIGDMGIVNQSTTPGAIVFGIGSLYEKGRFSSSGNLLLGTATDSGTYKIDIVGKLRAKSSQPQALFTVDGTTGLFMADGTNASWKSWQIGTSVNDGSDLSFTPSTNTSGTPTWGTTTVVFQGNGRVGIGNISPGFKLDIGGGTNAVAENTCRIGNTPGYTNGLTVIKDTSNIYLFDWGASSILRSAYTYANTTANLPNLEISAGGTFERSTASSIRYKENIKDWNDNGLNTILALRPKTFTYKADYYKNPNLIMLGLIAEEVAEVCPYLAEYENDDRTGQVENVRYATIVVPLIKAIKELNEKLVRNNIN